MLTTQCYLLVDLLIEDEPPMTPFLAACANVVPVPFCAEESLPNVLPLELNEERFGTLFDVRTLDEPMGKPLLVPVRRYPEAPI